MPRRPGFRTSEFLVALLSVLGVIVSALQDYISAGGAVHLSVYGAIAYIVSRGLAKYEPRPEIRTAPPSPPPAA